MDNSQYSNQIVPALSLVCVYQLSLFPLTNTHEQSVVRDSESPWPLFKLSYRSVHINDHTIYLSVKFNTVLAATLISASQRLTCNLESALCHTQLADDTQNNIMFNVAHGLRTCI